MPNNNSPLPPPTDVARLLMVEKDVSGLKDSMTSLASTVDKGFTAISNEMKARSSVNWQPIGICLAAVFTVSGWGFGLFNSYQARTDAAIAEQKVITASFMPRADVGDRFAAAKEKNDLRQGMTDARIARIEGDLENISKQIVPRGEHAEQWAHQRSTDSDLRRSIEEVRKQLGELNSPRDTVQRILKRLDDLDAAIVGRK